MIYTKVKLTSLKEKVSPLPGINRAPRSPPHLVELHDLEGVTVGIPEEHGRAPALGRRIGHPRRFQLCHQGRQVLDADAEVAVPAPVVRAELQVGGVGVGQLHEVNHLRPYPQPGPAVREAVVGAVGVEGEAQEPMPELERLLEVLTQEADVVDSLPAQLPLGRGQSLRFRPHAGLDPAGAPRPHPGCGRGPRAGAANEKKGSAPGGGAGAPC
mmetsp:Transcript_24937/g.78985  ORF Transcript_24937/g.78985 Transcript_24937/m.78985 type:complete len:213 (+) Transcript_24937:331-969(+)